MAEWLCSGLQSRVPRFDSGSRLQTLISAIPLAFLPDSSSRFGTHRQVSQDPLRLKPEESRILWCLAALQFCHIVDFMIMMPLAPSIMREMQINAAEFGLLVSSYTYAAALSGLLAMRWIDRYCRRRLLLWLFSGFLVSTLACALVSDYWGLVAARAAAGTFGGLVAALVHTFAGDVVADSRRGQASAVIMSAFSVSTVLGVPLSLAASAYAGWRAPFVFLAVGGLVLLWLAARLLPSLRCTPRPEIATESSLTPLATVRSLWPAYVLSGLVIFPSFMIIPYITLHFTTIVGLPEAQLTWLYLAGGVATLVTAQLIGRAVDQHGRRRVYRVLAATATLPMLLLTLMGPLGDWALMGSLVVMTLFFVLVSGRTIPVMAIVTGLAPPSRRGQVLALNSTVQQISMGTASWLGGVILASTAVHEKPTAGYAWVGLMAVLLSLAGLLWSARREFRS